MVAPFSGAVKLADLDDYLGPSQACVKPLLPPSKGDKVGINKGATVEVEVDVPAAPPRDGHFNQIRVDKVKKTATVSLNDCLACSGCVTSAETVLITQQSVGEFVQHLGGAKLVIVTVSPQSLAALAVHYELSLLETARRLTAFLKSLGVHRVIDSACALDISLVEARAEFLERFAAQRALPVLAGECPGWVCYAEKTQGDVLPLISTVRSPQQIMGTIVKRFVARDLGKTAEQVYHATIMPCFDKKLEGARNDFFDEDSKSRDVDCVLATMELLSIIEERGCDFRKLEGAALDPLFRVSEDGAALVGATDSGASGGYLDDIFRHAAAKLFGRVIEGPLPFKVNPRIPDLREVVLEVDGKPVLHFVIAYGFRNVQNLVRKIKKGGCGYHYVEVMACPSGCLNGGGQIKPASRDPKAQKALLAELDRVYHSRRVQAPESSPIVQRLYRECFGGAPGAPSARKLLHTQFHAVDKTEINPLAIKW